MCTEARDSQEPDVDCFGSAIDGHIKLFTLLQHLTMLDADAPVILGEFRIPMLFFKRLKTIENHSNLNRSSFKKPSVSNYYSFLSFESNEKSGLIEKPRIITSLHKVVAHMKAKGLKITKLKEDRLQG